MLVPGTMKEVISHSLIDGGDHSCSELVLGLGEGGDSSKIRLSEKSVSRSVSSPESSSQTWRRDSSDFACGFHQVWARYVFVFPEVLNNGSCDKV